MEQPLLKPSSDVYFYQPLGAAHSICWDISICQKDEKGRKGKKIDAKCSKKHVFYVCTQMLVVGFIPRNTCFQIQISARGIKNNLRQCLGTSPKNHVFCLIFLTFSSILKFFIQKMWKRHAQHHKVSQNIQPSSNFIWTERTTFVWFIIYFKIGSTFVKLVKKLDSFVLK